MSEFWFRFRFRDLECLTFGSETDPETRLEPRVSAFWFRDERTGNLCSMPSKIINNIGTYVTIKMLPLKKIVKSQTSLQFLTRERIKCQHFSFEFVCVQVKTTSIPEPCQTRQEQGHKIGCIFPGKTDMAAFLRVPMPGFNAADTRLCPPSEIKTLFRFFHLSSGLADICSRLCVQLFFWSN